MFERILVPLDGSRRAEAILPQLKRVLNRVDSEILLVRAYGLPATGQWSGVAGQSLAAEREAAEKYIHDEARSLSEPGAKVHGRVVQGPAAEAILETAVREGATMIAMSSHGRTGLSRWAMGSVAEKVIRASRIPVLLVRSFRASAKGEFEPSPVEEMPFRKMLVPTDGSPASVAVVGAAEKFAQLYGSEVAVLHARVPLVQVAFAGMGAGAVVQEPPLPPPYQDPATAEAAKRFEHAGLKVTRFTVEGDPAAAILDHATAAGVDLIAMGTHGRSGVSRWMLGSVAERVMRHAAVPLLLVRADPQRKKERKGPGRAVPARR